MSTLTFNNDEPQVPVAAGIIVQDDKVLLCKRGINHRYGLKWEFPGGKPYPDETLEECLTRELEEELGIVPTEYTSLKTLQAEYPDGGDFLLTFFLVTGFTGDITNKVFDDIAWVTPEEFGKYEIIEGSRPMLSHIPELIAKAKKG